MPPSAGNKLTGLGHWTFSNSPGGVFTSRSLPERAFSKENFQAIPDNMRFSSRVLGCYKIGTNERGIFSAFLNTV
jgi:hypothetical protein